MSARGTRRSTFQGKRGIGKFGIVKIWLKRTGLMIVACVALVWLGSWLFLSGTMTRAGDWMGQQTISMSAGLGFRVSNLLVEGREHTDPAVILGIVNTEKGEPIFGFDPVAAREQIEKISWVKTARIERRLPDTIYVRIEERTPMALWQHDNKLALIDSEGQVLTESNLAPYKDLIMLVGSKAPEHADELLAMLAAEPEIAKQVDSALWVGERRWDLLLSNNIAVRLPEEDMGLALKRLAMAAQEDGLLQKDITEVDLREMDRLVVRTRPGNVQEFKASYSSAGGNDI